MVAHESAQASVLATKRLLLREFVPDDAPFVLELLNDPGWIRFIGDRGVRDVEQARRYLAKGPIAMYGRLGFGLWHVALAATGEPLGMCGLIKRDSLEDVDLGFALLERHRGHGYAREAAEACRDYATGVLGLPRIVAITMPDNHDSSRLLERLGFRFERVTGPDDDPVRLYAFEPG